MKIIYLLLCLVGLVGLASAASHVLNLKGYHKIGVAKWCMVSREDKTIQCNYETMGDCQGYQSSNEYCLLNQDYK